jgi:cytochrome bd-type quinol oxidase subunit 2
MALPLFLYLIVLSSIGFGSGWCYGPRYWVAFLPWLALGTVEAIRRAGRYQRALCAILVLFGVAIAIPGALRYPQLFYKPVFDAWRGFY